MVKLLLSRRAKINTIGDLSGSALHTSSRYGNTAVVELLLSKGAEINMVNVDGLTALMLAAIYGNTAVFELLLSKGAEINVADMGGLTALMWAADHGHKIVIELLLKNGADARLKNKKGKIALNLVKNLEISIMLRKHLSTENQSNSPVSYPLENPNASPKIYSLLTTSHVETQSKVPLGYKAIWNDKYEEW